MCGRYASFLPAEALSRIFGTRNPPPNIEATWNLAPAQLAPVVRRHPETGERHLDLLTWGFLAQWTPAINTTSPPINARAETVATSGMFREAFARRRCIVPADVFYEWRVVKGSKQPYAIARQDGRPMAFAGIWAAHYDLAGTVRRTFAIITTAAGPDVAKLHSRMPVILEPVDWPAWLGEVEGDPASLLRPSRAHTLQMWPVDRRVGNPKNNGPELIQPVELAS